MRLFIVIAFILNIACSKENQFTDQGQKPSRSETTNLVDQPSVELNDPVQVQPTENPNDCVSGIDNLSKLTQSISSNVPFGIDSGSRLVEFQISLESCKNEVVRLSDLTVHFDLDARTSNDESIEFSIIDPAAETPIYKDFLTRISGRDLFGVESPSRGHWLGVVSELETRSKTLTIQFNLTDQTIQPIDYNPNAALADQTQQAEIKSYFKIGTSPAVELPLTLNGIQYPNTDGIMEPLF